MIEAKHGPFTIYDFLGYFTPGALLVIGTLVGLYYIDHGGSYNSVLLILNDINAIYIIVPFIIISYVIGHIVTFIASITVEKYAVWSVGYPSSYLLDESTSCNGRYFNCGVNKLGHYCVLILMMPVVLQDIIIGSWLNLRGLYIKPLDAVLRGAIQSSIDRLGDGLGVRSLYTGASSDNVDWFRFAYHYVLRYSPGYENKLRYYVAQFGFLRAMTLFWVLLFWLSLLSVYVCAEVGICLAVALIAALMSYVFYMSFLKFYKRYTLETLMALTLSHYDE